MTDNTKQSPKSTPPPSVDQQPVALKKEGDNHKTPTDPTRFGDWEKNGRCIDF
ncbi:MAG: DUF1674 domain-containing protein [Methylococcales bacterium]|jgi:hypothetical protein|nr:DUF1674 domain-containing protein [Methylococcales bacterium]